MNLHRVICLSDASPVGSADDVLGVCRDFPARNTQAGIGGKLLCVGQQYVLMLEGPRRAVLRLVQRLRRDAPLVGMTLRWSADADEPAFVGWSLGDVYLDEVEREDPAAAEALNDLVIDLLAVEDNELLAVEDNESAERGDADPADDEPADDEPAETPDRFAAAAALLDRFASTAGRPPAAATLADAA